MKFIVFFSCIVLFSSSGILGGVIRVKRHNQMDQTAFLNEMNTMRKAVAIHGNVSNVWKLQWSQELVNKAFSLKIGDCLGLAPAYNYRFFYHDGNEDAQEYERGWFEWFQLVVARGDKEAAQRAHDELASRTAYFLERLNPMQSKVGCIPHKCAFDIPNPKAVEPLHLEYKYICFIGPYGQFPRDESIGVPGSRCGMEGHNEDGLCVEN